jgi:hypothetical protein
MPVEMERGAVSARDAKSAERRARIEASIFFTAGGAALLRRPLAYIFASQGALALPPVVGSPLLGDQPQHVSRVVFRSVELRLPAFCPAWNGSRATADRASGDQLSQRAFIGDPDRHLIGCPAR